MAAMGWRAFSTATASWVLAGRARSPIQWRLQRQIEREAMTPNRFLAATAVCFAALSPTPPVQAATWSWDYSAAGIAANGTFTTTDTPDSAGFYTVTAITGSRNGIAITGLEADGSAIPGNDPYAVDNLVSIAGTATDLERLRLRAGRWQLGKPLL